VDPNFTLISAPFLHPYAENRPIDGRTTAQEHPVKEASPTVDIKKVICRLFPFMFATSACSEPNARGHRPDDDQHISPGGNEDAPHPDRCLPFLRMLPATLQESIG